jgi:hypothetical protein
MALGIYWLDNLTGEEQVQFCKNRVNLRSHSRIFQKETIAEYLLSEFDTFSTFIDSGFVWSLSTEPEGFWMEMSQRNDSGSMVMDSRSLTGSGIMYLAKLPYNLQVLYLKRFSESTEDGGITISRHLLSALLSYNKFVSAGFTWSDTPEGYGFWKKVSMQKI